MKRLLLATFILIGGLAWLAQPALLSNADATVENRSNAEATAYSIDNVHSAVIFRIKHLGVAYFYGRFNQLDGVIHWNDDNPENSRFDLRIDADSVDTNHSGRDEHLRSPDFFNVSEHPEITFKSNRIERRSEGRYRMTGELKLHGESKTITVDLHHTGAGEHPRSGRALHGFESVFRIKRSDFDMNYGIEAGAIGDEVELRIGIEALGSPDE
ncbi:MAG: YceI family protein [Phycisphaerales bacterium]|nr:MAG: YceI family protein [Phycisphaerales bacterium]